MVQEAWHGGALPGAEGREAPGNFAWTRGVGCSGETKLKIRLKVMIFVSGVLAFRGFEPEGKLSRRRMWGGSVYI